MEGQTSYGFWVKMLVTCIDEAYTVYMNGEFFFILFLKLSFCRFSVSLI